MDPTQDDSGSKEDDISLDEQEDDGVVLYVCSERKLSHPDNHGTKVLIGPRELQPTGTEMVVFTDERPKEMSSGSDDLAVISPFVPADQQDIPQTTGKSVKQLTQDYLAVQQANEEVHNVSPSLSKRCPSSNGFEVISPSKNPFLADSEVQSLAKDSPIPSKAAVPLLHTNVPSSNDKIGDNLTPVATATSFDSGNLADLSGAPDLQVVSANPQTLPVIILSPANTMQESNPEGKNSLAMYADKAAQVSIIRKLSIDSGQNPINSTQYPINDVQAPQNPNDPTQDLAIPSLNPTIPTLNGRSDAISQTDSYGNPQDVTPTSQEPSTPPNCYINLQKLQETGLAQIQNIAACQELPPILESLNTPFQPTEQMVHFSEPPQQVKEVKFKEPAKHEVQSSGNYMPESGEIIPINVQPSHSTQNTHRAKEEEEIFSKCTTVQSALKPKVESSVSQVDSNQKETYLNISADAKVNTSQEQEAEEEEALDQTQPEPHEHGYGVIGNEDEMSEISLTQLGESNHRDQECRTYNNGYPTHRIRISIDHQAAAPSRKMMVIAVILVVLILSTIALLTAYKFLYIISPS